MKGVILAGGAGSRLYPLTRVITKQLQPVYDKPMIFYPLSLLMLVGIQEILIITTSEDLPHFKRLLGGGERFGISLTYATQDAPNGIAQAYVIGEKFIAGQDSMLILGDNLFHGNFDIFRNAMAAHEQSAKQAHIFAYQVRDPERYGVVEFEKNSKKILSIEEKPEKPRSNYVIPGLYIFDGSAPERAKKQKPSPRGELEITDLVKSYLTNDQLAVSVIGRGMAWLDTGTPESLHEASAFVAALEQRQGFKVACLEEIALRMEYYNLQKYREVIADTPKSLYRTYMEMIAKEYEGHE